MQPVTPGARLRLGGFVSLSSCDWPGELVATVFCQGCAWRCRYCHNPHLLAARPSGPVQWPDVVALMRRRVGLLDGLVFSGGEPTVQRSLSTAIREIRALGFRIGLHTAGPYPDRLNAILPSLDWIAFDVKAPFDGYAGITAVCGSGRHANESLRAVIASGVPYEVRTTVHPQLLDFRDLSVLAESLAGMGVMHYTLQRCRVDGCLDTTLAPAPPGQVTALAELLRGRFPHMKIAIRNLD